MKITSLVLLSGLIFAAGCEKSNDLDTGYIEGHIAIGPICPVETDPPSAGCLPTIETYKAYPVYVYNADGSDRISLIEPSADGLFVEELQPGTYMLVLEIDNQGIGSSNLPQVVRVRPSGRTAVEIDIDTGIR